ncbi:hypothetical protein BCR33DRAFT_721167 [Rhizoclosmatium globosum]|uniref:Uncharacterized protein n=1 Tax=Rhizoclosmatium globosum TaxID=329046 RepID=A0A1Y2BTA4_9FUNG|nr:hypothetical protein BCR33DRAFT_721167 [Rhizoclosmatium globosum]|eukprot:ORY37973.1 hypothetical protein BCR33DRAFT_721167 [Rhizoclosmatium globosum]
MEYSLIPSLILNILGCLLSISIAIYLAGFRSGFLGTTIGKWIFVLLLLIVVGSIGCSIGIAALMFSPEWFATTSLPNQLFLALRFPIGCAVAGANFQIALERYWLVFHEESVPFVYTAGFGIHAAATITTVIIASVTSETYNYRRPGGTWQTPTLLVLAIQYMILAFGGLAYLYGKTYLHVVETLKQANAIGLQSDGRQRSEELRMRVLNSCIMLTMAFSNCYTCDAILVLMSLILPQGWNPPKWADVLAHTLVALDMVVTPILIVRLHSSLFEGTVLSTITSRFSSSSKSSKARSKTNGSIGEKDSCNPESGNTASQRGTIPRSMR